MAGEPLALDQIETTMRTDKTYKLVSYAVVAAANWASTYCQYDALQYVGFTTQALAKCAKMVSFFIPGCTVDHL
jgi:adenosine 3'-phospho 5'-phosphosulfate transporter B2